MFLIGFSTNSTQGSPTAPAPVPEINVKVIFIEESILLFLGLEDSPGVVHPIFKREAALNHMYFEHQNLVVYLNCTVKRGQNLLEVLRDTLLPQLNAERALAGIAEVIVNANRLDLLSLPNHWVTLEYQDLLNLPVSKVFNQRFVVTKTKKPCK